jgi:hypothetical protein
VLQRLFRRRRIGLRQTGPGDDYADDNQGGFDSTCSAV